MSAQPNTKHQRWLKGLGAACVLLMVLDLVVHRHGHFGWENWFGFYAVFAFAGSVIMILLAHMVFRPLLKREEDYYDD